MDAYIAWGHGIQTNGLPDNGCSFNNVTEAQLTGPIAASLVTTLRQHGLTVGSDVDSGNDRNITRTVQDANRNGAKLYVSVHCDYALAPSGTLPICHPASLEGYRLAQCLDHAVRTRLPIGGRGILRRSDFEVTATHMPAVIFETGSISADLTLLRDHAAIYGQAMASGILDFLGHSNTVQGTTGSLWSPSNHSLLLKSGDIGPAVGQLQRDLRAMAYEDALGHELIIDQHYGPATEYAVRRLQSFHNLEIDGLYGSRSDQALMQEIKAVQNKLIQLGYSLEADGVVGVQTEHAIKAFQQQHHLAADGIVGKNTLRALGLQS